MVTALVFLPLLGALLSGLFCRTMPAKLAQFITCSLLVTSAVLSLMTFHKVIILGQPETVELLRWLDSGDFSAYWKLRIDSLTAVMLVVVTVVSSIVHIYSVGYMHHDPHQQRFMAYLSLFTFSMLMLVTADNFIQLFFGWEGVGLCSYLLIGFWYKKPSANAAAMKAFIVNRVGDFGFALGIMAIFLLFNSVQFSDVFAAVSRFNGTSMTFLGMEFPALELICFLLFIGCMGKSAQLGLHTWLPDAMEGPTPVSALIHAATMVTAGVFLVARCSPIFEYAPNVLQIVTVVGAMTAIFAATVAVTQNDIKKVIAYSTCSQLGYMFFACGVSAYPAAIFHLMTHAFFKALLFLGAGNVIHAMSEEQDIRNMGGIAKKIPVTYAYMLLGSLALAGIPPFAGYYSKDIILESTFASGTAAGHFAFVIGLAAAFLTAFYSWRLLILVFHGTSRASEEVLDHVHESPAIMNLPLAVLAFGAVVAGYAGANILGMVSPSGAFWAGAIHILGDENILDLAHHVPSWVKFAPLAAGLSGITLAYICYSFLPRLPERIARRFRPIYLFLLNKWFFDEIYHWLFVKPAKAFGMLFWKVGDVLLIDGLGPNGAAYVSRKLSAIIGRGQTGYVYHYGFVMLAGVVALISWYVY